MSINYLYEKNWIYNDKNIKKLLIRYSYKNGHCFFRIQSYVDGNRLDAIQGKLSKMFILQTMAMPKKQNAYRDFFNSYGDKKQGRKINYYIIYFVNK